MIRSHLPSRVLAVAILGVFLLSGVSLAAQMRAGDTVGVPAGETIDGDLYLFGDNIIMHGNVEGDLVAAGRIVIVEGDIGGSLWIAGEDIRVGGSVGGSLRTAGKNVRVEGSIGRDVLAAASDFRFHGITGEDIWMAVGFGLFRGDIAGDVRGSAQRVLISGPIGGDVRLESEALQLSPEADIQGRLVYASDNPADVDPGARVAGGITQVPPRPRTSVPVFAERGRVVSVLGLILVGALFTWLFPGGVKDISSKISTRPWVALGLGFLLLIALPVAAVILGITLVGLPLGLILFALYIIAIYLSPVLVGHFLGHKLLSAMRKPLHPVLTVILGVLILSLLGRTAYIGGYVRFAVVLFGMGALAVWVLSFRRPGSPSTHKQEEDVEDLDSRG